MGGKRGFEDFEVWRDALDLADDIYRGSNRGPFADDRALKDQIRRASISVVSNIAEGFESRTTGLYVDFLGRAKASAGEMRAQLHLVQRLGYVDDETASELTSRVTSISRQLCGLMKYLERSNNPK